MLTASLACAALLAMAVSPTSAFAQSGNSLNLTLPVGFKAGAPDGGLRPWLAPKFITVVEKDANDQLGFAVGFRLSNRIALVGQVAESNRLPQFASGGSALTSQKNMAYGLDVVGALPLFDKFALMGNAGLSRERNDPSLIGSNALGFDFGRNGAFGTTARVGLGLQYDINAGLGFSIGIERKRHFGVALLGGDVDADRVLLGARIRF